MVTTAHKVQGFLTIKGEVPLNAKATEVAGEHPLTSSEVILGDQKTRFPLSFSAFAAERSSASLTVDFVAMASIRWW